MPRLVLVNIDIERLRTNLARADQRDVSAEEILRFLADSGFRRTERGWVVTEENLGQLDPAEVLSAEFIEQ